MDFLLRFCVVPLIIGVEYWHYERRGRRQAVLYFVLFFVLTGILFLL